MSTTSSSPLPSLSTTPPNPSSLPLSSTPRSLAKTYRPGLALPFELNAHITVYFEEQLYAQAFALLQSLVSSSAHADPTQPTYVPSSIHLALASTVTVHPAFTTTVAKNEEWNLVDSAFRLLRSVSQVVGPVSADFKSALRFSRYKSGNTRSRGGAHLRNNGLGNSACDSHHLDDTKIMCRYAQEESMYTCAEDFWHVVGWAFNCSRLHPTRWTRWFLWLEWMISLLEDDWRCRMQDSDERSSLIWSYMTNPSPGRTHSRRMMRAIFANGSNKTVNEFREVFRKESKEPPKEGDQTIRRREVEVDVEAEVYGDYMREDESSDDEPNRGPLSHSGRLRAREPKLRRVKSQASMTNLNSACDDGEGIGIHGPTYLGGSHSLGLRMRLLQLVSEVSVKLPDDFETGEELYTMFVEFIRPLPLPTFQAIISPSAVPDFLSADVQTTLSEFLLTRSLLEAAAPPSHERYLRQSKIEECYLPFAATSSIIADNAKVSLCLESLLRHLILAGKIAAGPSLESAIHQGIKHRCSKSSDVVKKSVSSRRMDELAWTYLIESGERLAEMCRRVRPS